MEKRECWYNYYILDLCLGGGYFQMSAGVPGSLNEIFCDFAHSS